MTDTYAESIVAEDAKRQAKGKRLLKLEIVDGSTLLTTHYQDPSYLWHEILPDAGLCVVAASKAAGKTLLLLQMADAIAKGCPFMGVATNPSKVLFLELELSQRRTAQRLAKMGLVPNSNLLFSFKWEQGENGLQDLAYFIEENRIQLVIVDVLQRLWPINADSNSYQDTYNILAPLRQMANNLNCMMILVTHRRKQETADYIDSVIGSTGIAANADVVLTLSRTRGENEAILSIDGNDIESQKLALLFEVNPLGFRKSNADPQEAGQTPERRSILDYLHTVGKARTGEIAKALGKNEKAVSMLLQKLKQEGLLMSAGYGEYSIYTPHGSGGSSGTNNGASIDSTTSIGSQDSYEGEQLDIF